jgi:hypothetical protein
MDSNKTQINHKKKSSQMELAATYAPHQHEATHVNNTHDERMAARKLGQCAGCDNQTHKIGKNFLCCGETRTALTIPGPVFIR